MTYTRAHEHWSRRQGGPQPRSLGDTVPWIICWGWDGGRCSVCEGRLRLQPAVRDAAPSQGTAGPGTEGKARGKGSQRRLKPTKESEVGLRVPMATHVPFRFVSHCSRNIFTGLQLNAISSLSNRIDTKTSFQKHCWIICRVLFKNIGRYITQWSAVRISCMIHSS